MRLLGRPPAVSIHLHTGLHVSVIWTHAASNTCDCADLHSMNATGSFGMACSRMMCDMRVSCDKAHSPDHLGGVHDAALLLEPLHVWLACCDSGRCHEDCPSQLRALQASGLLHQIPATKLVVILCVSPW